MKRAFFFAGILIVAVSISQPLFAQTDKEKEAANKIAREGSDAAKDQDWDKAVEKFREAVKTDKKYDANLAAALQQRATAAANDRRFQDAIDDFSDALKASPHDAGIYERRAAVEMKISDMDKALADYGEAIKINPHEARFYSYRAYIYEVKGDLQNSMADTDRVLKMDKKNAEAVARKQRLETRIKIQSGQQPATTAPAQNAPPPPPPPPPKG